MSVFLTYLPMFLLKFRSRELVGCGIKLRIQRVPTRHTFDGPSYPKKKKYLKNGMMTSSFHFFQVFLLFGVAGSIKSMPSGYSLDAEFNSTSNELHHHSIFSGISCFWGNGVRQKYAEWVLVGCRIKFRIQGALPIKI